MGGRNSGRHADVADKQSVTVLEAKLQGIEKYDTAINHLTMQERVFVTVLLQTMNVQEAGRQAGLESISSTQAFLQRKSVKKALAEAQKDLRLLFYDHCAAAFHTLAGLMMDEKAPHSVRLKAAQDIMDRAGYKPTEKSVVLHGEIPESAVVKELMGRAARLVEESDDGERRKSASQGPKRLPPAGAQ